MDATDPRLQTDRSYDFAPATGVGSLIAGLEYRNDQARLDDDTLDVQTITQPDGTLAFIVDTPGTQDGAHPFEAGASTNDMNTNLHVLAGQTTARELAIAEAVQQAIQAARADPDAPVMLVGHSRGGMVAAKTAADSEALGLDITHVVTAGSPIALADIPSDVQVLSLAEKRPPPPTTGAGQGRRWRWGSHGHRRAVLLTANGHLDDRLRAGCPGRR